MNPSCPHPLGPPPSVLPEASPTPSAGLYNFEDGYDYISEPNENLVCPICRNPFIEPVMCESTDHIFCQSCLIKSLEVSATCPIDRLPLSLSLIVPAPKIINKLVDELLVSCPFKAKLGCSFVCQRDLIQTHIHSHQAQLDQLASDESLYPQVHGSSQNAPLLDSTVFQRSRLGLTSPKSCLLRFQWLENRATLVSKPQSQIQIDSGPDSASNQPKLSPCPFERFGCSFMGTPEAITQQHLSVTSDSTISTDEPRCQFASMQEILHWFEHLEARNAELKVQLSQSLVQQGQLTSVLDKLKISFRQLWRSQQSGGTHSPLTTLASSGPGSLHRASILSRLEIPDHYASSEVPSPGHSAEASPIHHSSDDPSSTSGSRMAYALNGARLRRCDDQSSSAVCTGRCAQFYSPIGSPAKLKVRVKTFLRRGEVLTPASEDLHHELPTAPIAADQLPHPAKIAPSAGPASLSSSHSSLHSHSSSASGPVSDLHPDTDDPAKRTSWW
ncbi:hypothetical protein PGT21_026808 [Puccinia graminis f. sp. tritici]|uniref:RING-type domain-containing protein n=2 Tax=Puccinia graminis f. sp. tritici TaxID=56615 RepID=A0A5B0R5V6_PUCGR|nr:hypothetical protein PGT21_026808 [Puccinia graminis f. sp. tritici]KAA1120902.1 hypothetical protein PGTUg99_014009 [Puccinia graminis f. sp. tritici]